MPGSAPKVETTTLVTVLKKSLKATNKKATVKSIPDPSTSSNSHITTTEQQGLMSSISTLLTGLDFIFYIWTFLLVALVTYLSLKKYYQIQKDRLTNMQQKTTTNQARNNSQTTPTATTTTMPGGLIASLFHVLFRLASTVVNLFTKYCLTSKNRSNSGSPCFWAALLFGVGKQTASYTYLNNCLKWFYFNSETVKCINASIIKKLNAAAVLSNTTFKNSTKRSSLVSLSKIYR